MPVVCANLPSHNELMPDGACIPPDDEAAWSEAITSIVEVYQSNKPNTRKPDLGLIKHAQNYDNAVFCKKFGESYSSIIT